jgi:hypothetical protein
MESKILIPAAQNNPTKLTLTEVQKKFETWRKTREKRTRIPKELWGAAIALLPDHTPYEISKTLSINFSRLEKQILSARVEQPKIKPPSFIELDIGKNNSNAECILEVENKAGSKMKLYFKNNPSLDLMEFSKAFLNQTK